MPKFRKIPVEIEAMQVPPYGSPEGWTTLHVWLSSPWQDRSWNYNGKGGVIINTLEGDHLAEPGDWIIRGVKNEIYPCKPDIFEATYDPVE